MAIVLELATAEASGMLICVYRVCTKITINLNRQLRSQTEDLTVRLTPNETPNPLRPGIQRRTLAQGRHSGRCICTLPSACLEVVWSGRNDKILLADQLAFTRSLGTWPKCALSMRTAPQSSPLIRGIEFDRKRGRQALNCH